MLGQSSRLGKNSQGMRPLKAEEILVIRMLAQKIRSSSQKSHVLEDLENCKVQDVLPNGARIYFEIAGYSRPSYNGQHAFVGEDGFPVEGTVRDEDGAEIEVYIFADENNRLLELELLKHAPGEVVRPDWTQFRTR